MSEALLTTVSIVAFVTVMVTFGVIVLMIGGAL